MFTIDPPFITRCRIRAKQQPSLEPVKATLKAKSNDRGEKGMAY
jgi:hypothetical protein